MKITDEQVAVVKDALCTYDPRSPYYDAEDAECRATGTCFCDNCFHGNTILAELILDMIG